MSAKRFINSVLRMLALCLTLVLTACDATIHFYPEPEEEPEPAETYETLIEYDIDLTAPKMYKEVTYDSDWERTERELEPLAAAQMLPEADMYQLRIVVEVYSAKAYERAFEEAEAEQLPTAVLRREFIREIGTEHVSGSFEASLPVGEYKILAWADFVRRDSESSWHYYPDNLHFVTTDVTTYPADTRLRCAFAGDTEFEVAADGSARVNLTRCGGRFRIQATDVGNFLTRRQRSYMEDLKVRITYSRFVGVAYNISRREPADFVSSYTFTVDVTNDDLSMSQGTVSLAIDYIFAGDERENHVIAAIEVLGEDGQVINTVQDVDIPLWRNRETLVRGNFLTRPHGEGMYIDENFDNEVIITF